MLLLTCQRGWEGCPQMVTFLSHPAFLSSPGPWSQSGHLSYLVWVQKNIVIHYGDKLYIRGKLAGILIG